MNKTMISIVLCSSFMLSACVGSQSSKPPAFLLSNDVTMSVITDYQEKDLTQKLSNKFTVDKNATSLLLTVSDANVFESDNETIKSSIKKDLDIIAQAIVDSPHSEIKIVSHTDDTVEYYDGLITTTRKAQELKDYMYERNIREKRITFYGLSYDKPIIKNASNEDKIKNRRIEIQINNI